MNSLSALRLLLTAGELLAGSSLIVALAWLGANRSTASMRHLTWLAGFVALLLLPVMIALMPAQLTWRLAAPAALPALQNMPVVAATIVPVPVQHFTLDVQTVMWTLLALWIAGVIALVVRGAIALQGLRTLRRESVGHVFRQLPPIAERFELRIATEGSVWGPVTWGFRRPVVLLPKSADAWSVERLNAVLLHEAAHIRRGDSVSQMLTLIVCALYWPNPAVWLAARALRREAEIAADDAVIVSGVKPSYYAAELLHLASRFRAPQPALAQVPIFMAGRAALQARVESVLAPTQPRNGVTKMDVLKIACAGLLATTALAALHPALAQDAPPPPPPPPALMAPPAPEALPAPPAPAADVAPVPPVPNVAPLPPVPPVEAINDRRVREYDRHDRNGHHMHIIVETDGHDGHDVDVTVDGKQIEEAMRQARPQIERAMAELHANKEMLRNVQPQIDRAMRDARIQMARAHMDVKIQESIDRALKRMEIRVEARDPHNADRGATVDMETTDTPDAPDAPDAPDTPETH